MTKNRGACALTRLGESLHTIKLKSACREPDLSLSGLDPAPLSKIGTYLLASLGSKGKNSNSLDCLGNAGSYSAESYCKDKEGLIHKTKDKEAEACCRAGARRKRGTLPLPFVNRLCLPCPLARSRPYGHKGGRRGASFDQPEEANSTRAP